MKIWTFTVLILTLGLGLSISGLILGYRKGLWENVARLFLTGVLGVIITAISLVLIFIAVWPPYNALSVVLTLGFVALVVGVLLFVRSTNATDPQLDLDT